MTLKLLNFSFEKRHFGVESVINTFFDQDGNSTRILTSM